MIDRGDGWQTYLRVSSRGFWVADCRDAREVGEHVNLALLMEAGAA